MLQHQPGLCHMHMRANSQMQHPGYLVWSARASAWVTKQQSGTFQGQDQYKAKPLAGIRQQL